MTTMITVCMSGTHEHARAAFDKHLLPTRSIIEVVGGRVHTVAQLPDTDDVRAKMKDLAGEFQTTLLAVAVTTIYPGANL